MRYPEDYIFRLQQKENGKWATVREFRITATPHKLRFWGKVKMLFQR